MFLFIFESIGWQELILIGVIALIVFGPRKLPQFARTAGKLMAEFRKATSDFKETWEREVDFEEYKRDFEKDLLDPEPKTIAKNKENPVKQLAEPEIREIRQEDFERRLQAEPVESKTEPEPVKSATGKQDWL